MIRNLETFHGDSDSLSLLGTLYFLKAREAGKHFEPTSEATSAAAAEAEEAEIEYVTGMRRREARKRGRRGGKWRGKNERQEERQRGELRSLCRSLLIPQDDCIRFTHRSVPDILHRLFQAQDPGFSDDEVTLAILETVSAELTTSTEQRFDPCRRMQFALSRARQLPPMPSWEEQLFPYLHSVHLVLRERARLPFWCSYRLVKASMNTKFSQVVSSNRDGDVLCSAAYSQLHEFVVWELSNHIDVRKQHGEMDAAMTSSLEKGILHPKT